MASVVTNRESRGGGVSRAGRLSPTAGTVPVPEANGDGRASLRTLTGVEVLATGSYVPEPVVRNEDLARLGCDPDWIIQRTGIRERRHAPAEMATSDLACEAARRCIEQAGVRPEEIDLLILGTTTPDSPLPSTACRVQNKLGISAPSMDLNAACAGFMYGLVTGMHFVAAGSSRLALVLGADILSRIVNPEDKKTYPLFGDAAGAVLLGKGSSQQGLVSYTLGADGSRWELLHVPGGGSREPLSAESLTENRQFLCMEGRPIFKWAVRMLSETIREVLGHAEITMDQVRLVLMHQANVRIIDAAASDLGIDPQKVVVNLDRVGNTSAGSIPLVLDEAHREGRIRRGDHIVLSGFGAGLCWGTAVLRW